MQFKVGEFIVHPIYGIGHIVKIEEKRFSEKEKQLYYKVILSNRTMWIPVEAQVTSRLRLVTAKSELDRYRDLLKSSPAAMPTNHHRRYQDLTDRLKQGSFRVICEVVRDLTAWSLRKPLGPTDRATLQKTRERLYQEWATAAGVSRAEAIEEVDTLLEAAQELSSIGAI